MENKELQQILLQMDSDRGRTTKIKILKILSKSSMNPHEISRRLNMKSYSHVNKFLNFLYSLYLIDYNEESFSNEYKSYVRRKWFLTSLGKELISFIKGVSLSKELTPRMFEEKLKRDLRNCKEYKDWREDIIKKCEGKCSVCGQQGRDIQVHHKKEFKKILEEYKIQTLEQGINCKELWDINNGTCLCSFHHYEEHE